MIPTHVWFCLKIIGCLNLVVYGMLHMYHAFNSLSTVKIVGYVRTLQLVHKLNQYTLDSIVLSVQISKVRMQIMSLCQLLFYSLQANPFREKMCDIFSVSMNGMMTFVEFVDMISAFSPKVYYYYTDLLLQMYVSCIEVHLMR